MCSRGFSAPVREMQVLGRKICKLHELDKLSCRGYDGLVAGAERRHANVAVRLDGDRLGTAVARCRVERCFKAPVRANWQAHACAAVDPNPTAKAMGRRTGRERMGVFIQGSCVTRAFSELVKSSRRLQQERSKAGGREGFAAWPVASRSARAAEVLRVREQLGRHRHRVVARRR